MSNGGGRNNTVVIVIFVFVGLILLGWWGQRQHSELEKCCREVKQKLETLIQGGGDIQGEGQHTIDPGPGPVISVGPKKITGDKYETQWALSGTPLGSGDFGDPMELHVDAMEKAIDQFNVEVNGVAASINLTFFQIEYTDGETLTVMKNAAGGLDWTYTGGTLVRCYDEPPSPDEQQCSNSGIPPELHGEIEDINTYLAIPANKTWKDIKEILMDLDS